MTLAEYAKKYKAPHSNLINKAKRQTIEAFLEKGVCEITDIIGLPQPTISSHLKLLENAGLIESYKDGLWANYNINSQLGSFSSAFIEIIYKDLEKDRQIASDLKKLKNINRWMICRKRM